MEYKILTEEGGILKDVADRLSKRIMKYLSDGWELKGNLIVVYQDGWQKMAQVVIKGN